jgi:sporulation protein YlmC with PRC-barrel domain
MMNNDHVYPLSESNQKGENPMTTQIFSTTSLLNNPVQNTLEEDLGNIKDLMFDLDSGRIVYAVLSFGGILGLGDKLFAVPWGALHLDTENERFVLNVPKAALKNAPGFDKKNWPDMADQMWARKIDEFYNELPSLTEES